MRNLYLEESIETPKVILDKGEGIFTFEGKSLPEDVKEFYRPILEWFDDYILEPNSETEINIKFEYFNTSSSKMILVLMKKLIDAKKKGSNVTINWHYPYDDEEIFEAGEEYAEIIMLPFNFIKY